MRCVLLLLHEAKPNGGSAMIFGSCRFAAKAWKTFTTGQLSNDTSNPPTEKRARLQFSA